MSLIHNISIDQDAFQQASSELEELSSSLEALRTKISTMLDTLDAGFDTPAGRAFRRSCEDNLMRPLDDQRLVLDQVSQMLQSSRQQYESVFNAYEDLNNAVQL